MLLNLLALASAMPGRIYAPQKAAANGAIKSVQDAFVGSPIPSPAPVKTVHVTLNATTTRVVYRAKFVDLEAAETSGPALEKAVAMATASTDDDSVDDQDDEYDDEDDTAEAASVTGLVNATRPTHHGQRSHSINATREFQFNHTTASHISTLVAAGHALTKVL